MTFCCRDDCSVFTSKTIVLSVGLAKKHKLCLLGFVALDSKYFYCETCGFDPSCSFAFAEIALVIVTTVELYFSSQSIL